MSYTIRFPNTYGELTAKFARKLLMERIAEDGRFTMTMDGPFITYRGLLRRENPRFYLRLKAIRFAHSRDVGGKHTRWLDNSGWITFNNLVNDVFDSMKVEADIWSTPNNVKGCLWIRHGLTRRYKWDFMPSSASRDPGAEPLWNPGTPDQFEAP